MNLIPKIIGGKSNTDNDFKKKYSFKDRKEESKRVLNKYPDRIPVICQKRNVNDDTPSIKKTKFLVPKELTVAQFMSVVRKKIDLSEEKALFFYVNNFSIPNASEELQNIYYKEKDEDQFLYFTYCAENTFG